MPKLVYHDSSGARGSLELGSEPCLIGRANECQIQTQDGLVSRRHAKVTYDGSYWVEDNGSANGVYVGSERVQRYKLRPGDTFRCGHLEVRFEVEERNRTAIGVAPQLPAVGQAIPAAKVAASAAALGGAGSSPVLQAISPPGAAVSSDPTVPLRASAKSAPSTSSAPPIVAKATPNAASVPPPVPVAEPVPPAATANASELVALRNELETERRRRSEMQSERDEALRRAAEAQQRLDEEKRRAEEAQRKLDGLAAQANSDGDHERLRRRVEQLESELRRKGGSSAASGGGSAEAVKALEAERDRLRVRVAELEAQGADPQAQAKGQAAATAARVAELEEKVRRLTEERDAAEWKAAGADARPNPSEELERAKRRIDQLEAEARRRSVGTVSDEKRRDAQRTELEAALRQLRDTERERDALREVVAQHRGGLTKAPQQLTDSLTAISDGLADVRAALRAAGDDLALEQLEEMRNALRQACAAAGIPL